MSGSVRIAILAYHSLDESGSVLSTSPRTFAEQMRILRELQITVIPLSEIGASLKAAPSGANLAAVTFDDGFRNVYDHALPVQQRYGLPITVFLVTDHCGRTNAWPGQPAGIEPHPLLHWSQVRELSAAGFELGSHTRTHPDLTTVTKEEAEEEMVASRRAIEDEVGQTVHTHAYPYGTYNAAVRELASRHFSLACSTRLGFAGARSDTFALERLDMYYLRSLGSFRRLFSHGMGAYIGLRRALRGVRSWAGGRHVG